MKQNQKTHYEAVSYLKLINLFNTSAILNFEKLLCRKICILVKSLKPMNWFLKSYMSYARGKAIQLL